MKRNELLLVGVLATLIAGAAVLLPPIAEAQTESGVPVEYVDNTNGLETPTGSGWEEIQTATLPLSSAGADVPSANDVTVEQIQVKAVRTNSQIRIRMSWTDPTRDMSESSVREFDDNVAIQLPADGEEEPPIAMGSPENPVNIWYWSGSGNSEELLAGGPGTTTPVNESTLRTEQAYENGRWHVMFTRPLDPRGDARTTIPREATDLNIAFAVWNGSNMEVAGQKSASQWHRLAVSSGPPPYERFLWVVAGVMIVVTTLLTIEGIRRTGGE
ncbi:ethylbenzene dehydrogenase-related protein [Halorubrum salsamenti]|uniref:ethylbenzene dehydrogenase-related protein n=1 Tax=Halorubrum salsamenti TaxID=2583990 RepID=UPI0011A429F2|nr:ethylbenzene dehydrogenase-related protein [Halorubrum salsamenti]